MKSPIVLILAAGKCTRFWPLKNKSLYPFLGQPLLKLQIDQLRSAGFKDICVVGNQENEPEIKKLNIKYVLQKGEGQTSAILSAAKEIKGPVIIVNADDIFSGELLIKAKDLIDNENPDAFLTAVSVKEYFPGGYFKIEKNIVTAIIEKPGPDKMPSHLFRLVLDYFKESEILINSLKTTGANGLYENSLNILIREGLKINCLNYEGKWGSLKYPWHVLDIMNIFLNRITKKSIAKSAVISKSAIIEGNVVIEDNVKVFENAKIVGPCWIGKNAVIGNNVILRESMIGEGSVVGFSTDIARSYIGKDCWFHSNYLGDSILENNIGMGAGANLANLRLDEKSISSVVQGNKVDSKRNKLGVIIGSNVRIGINSSIMPGVKIGSGTFIASGTLLEHDLPENKFVCSKTELIIKDNLKSLTKNRAEFKKKI